MKKQGDSTNGNVKASVYLSNGILHSKIAESLSKNYRHFFYEHSDFALKKAKAEIIQIKF